jgi:hypothetical protein
MGNEIVYCRNCQTRLLSSDFERGAAFKIDGIASCNKCSADVLKLTKTPPAPDKAWTSVRIAPVVPKTPRPADPRKGLGAVGWLGVAAGAAGILILAFMALRDTPPQPPVEPPRKPAPAPTSDLAELEKQVNEAAARQDFGGALAAIQGARAKHGTPEWTRILERKSKELRDAAFRSSTALKDKAIEARRRGAEKEVTALREQVAKLGVPELLADVDRALKQVPEPSKGPRARFVRIENPNPILSLAEVQVFSNGENVALKGTASQDSNYEDGVASRAIDGNTNGEWGSRSVTHTMGLQPTSWWEVDLGRTLPIDKVVVWSRTEKLGDRMTGYAVQLLDEARQPVGSQKSSGYPDPSAEHVFGAPDRK